MKLDKYHSHFSSIAPVSPDISRPLWSVMIPTYNCATYLRETLTSVLAQDPGPEMMQITVVDDCSDDNPKSVVEEIGKGRVEFYQQKENVGLTKNFHTCLELSRGYLIHQLHGDDVVRNGFYRKMQQVFQEYPQIGAAFCRTIFIDEKGHWKWISSLELPETGILPDSWIKEIAQVCRIQTPSIVVARHVYEQLGGFDHRLRTAEDWEMWVRIAANYPIAHQVEPLALYRQHSSSNMQSNLNTGYHAEHLYKAISIFESYLRQKVPTNIYKHAKQNCSFNALKAANYLMNQGEFLKALRQIKSSLTYSRSFRVIRSAGRIILWNGSLCLLKKMKLNF